MRDCEINPSRKYIQFNDLVIDNYDMLESADRTYSTKSETMEYSFTHGSYVARKSRQQFLTEQVVTMTLNLDYQKLKRNQKEFYKEYIMLNILQHGRLWAIEGNELLWAFAFVQDIGEPYEIFRHTISMDLTFIIYEGVWHKADSKKVFLAPYDICNFADLEDFRIIAECLDCCVTCESVEQKPCPKCLSDCDWLTKENSLCEMKNEVVDDFYKQCGDTYRIIYNCEAGKKIWGNDMLGTKLCKKDYCDDVISGKFYSNTIVDSSKITIILTGKWQDPIITINGNRMQLEGDYDGIITIYSTGEVYYQEDECCPKIKLDLEKLKILDKFMWLIHHGINTVFVEGGCCSFACIYIKVDSLTT